MVHVEIDVVPCVPERLGACGLLADLRQSIGESARKTTQVIGNMYIHYFLHHRSTQESFGYMSADGQNLEIGQVRG